MTPPASDEPQRKLAAIMAIDVVGYSRMVSTDEVGTIKRITDARRDVIDPVIAINHGRVFKRMGDGLLVEFPSVVLALRAALVVQGRLAMHNAGQPAQERIVLRIGLHQSDVIVDGDDLLGDGVNTAARLEQLADPGGICISARVREDVAGKIALIAEDGGERELRNIPRPIHVYFIRPKTVRADMTGVSNRSPSQPSRALPGEGASDPLPGDFAERTMVGAGPATVHRLVLLTAPEPGLPSTSPTILGPRPLSIGRVPPSDLILPSADVSRAHCRIELVNNVPVVTDLNSTNGTFVDGHRIQAPTRLQPGSELRIGFYVWRYACEGADSDAERTSILPPAPH